TNFMHVNRSTLLASLREKYGKETAAFQNSLDTPATRDDQIVTMFWLIDERGQRATAPRSAGLLSLCGPSAPQGAAPNDELFHGTGGYNSSQLSDPWLRSSCIGTIITIQPHQDPQIIELMMATVVDTPLYVRSAGATAVWWKAAAERARQLE